MDNDHPIIVVSAMTMAQSSAYGRFLMAHECSHHTLGHVAVYKRELGHLGPQPFFYIAPQLRHMELDADCNAVRMLKIKNEPDTIEAARLSDAEIRRKAHRRLLPDRRRAGQQHRQMRCPILSADIEAG